MAPAYYSKKDTFISNCRDLIKTARTKDAIDLALQHFQNHPQYHSTIVLLSNRYNNLWNEYLNIGHTDQIEKNKVNQSLLEVLNEYERSSPNTIKPNNSFISSVVKKNSFWVLIVLVLLTFFMIIALSGGIQIGDKMSTKGNNSPIIQGDDASYESTQHTIKESIQ